MPQDYVIKTTTGTYRIRVPDGMSPDKALSLAAATNEGFAQEYAANKAHLDTMTSKMEPFSFSGPTVPRPPGGGEEAMLAEGAPPALEGLTTIGMGGALKQNPMAAIRGLIGSGVGAYGGAKGGRYAGSLIGMPEEGALVGGVGGGLLGGAAGIRGVSNEGTIPERLMSIFSNEKPVTAEMAAQVRAEAKAAAAAAKADAAARKAVPVSKSPGPYKGPSSVPEPSPFAGMSSTAPGAMAGSAELPPVPQGSPTPFPAVARKGGVSAPPTPEEPPQTGGPLDLTPQPKTSLLSRGRTVVQPGMEPDMANPTHVKMINDYQTMSGPALRQLASAGDRFAAFVLRHMPRP